MLKKPKKHHRHLVGNFTICKRVCCNLQSPHVKIKLAATCHLQTCYNLLKQLAARLQITSFDNQLETSLLITCNDPDIDLLKTSLFQDYKHYNKTFRLSVLVCVTQ